ncbi:uncharacterized protein [Triticum aestivum]|uniref:uncharacterized protein n=1 Tax=Triticum aestivum TaxID=4565 RepID=UPI001D00ACBC|nr:uncharacterized protein LOC123147366 [Triticum aestivum]
MVLLHLGAHRATMVPPDCRRSAGPKPRSCVRRSFSTEGHEQSPVTGSRMAPPWSGRWCRPDSSLPGKSDGTVVNHLDSILSRVGSKSLRLPVIRTLPRSGGSCGQAHKTTCHRQEAYATL